MFLRSVVVLLTILVLNVAETFRGTQRVSIPAGTYSGKSSYLNEIAIHLASTFVTTTGGSQYDYEWTLTTNPTKYINWFINLYNIEMMGELSTFTITSGGKVLKKYTAADHPSKDIEFVQNNTVTLHLTTGTRVTTTDPGLNRTDIRNTITNTIVLTATAITEYCSTAMFHCLINEAGLCIDEKLVRDGYDNCPQGSDEEIPGVHNGENDARESGSKKSFYLFFIGIPTLVLIYAYTKRRHRLNQINRNVLNASIMNTAHYSTNLNVIPCSNTGLQGTPDMLQYLTSPHIYSSSTQPAANDSRRSSSITPASRRGSTNIPGDRRNSVIIPGDRRNSSIVPDSRRSSANALVNARRNSNLHNNLVLNTNGTYHNPNLSPPAYDSMAMPVSTIIPPPAYKERED